MVIESRDQVPSSSLCWHWKFFFQRFDAKKLSRSCDIDVEVRFGCPNYRTATVVIVYSDNTAFDNPTRRGWIIDSDSWGVSVARRGEGGLNMFINFQFFFASLDSKPKNRH
jgi:hypothetical protein